MILQCCKGRKMSTKPNQKGSGGITRFAREVRGRNVTLEGILSAETNFFQLACIKNLIFYSNQNEEGLRNPQGPEHSFLLENSNLFNCNCKPDESRYLLICLKLVVAIQFYK